MLQYRSTKTRSPLFLCSRCRPCVSHLSVSHRRMRTFTEKATAQGKDTQWSPLSELVTKRKWTQKETLNNPGVCVCVCVCVCLWVNERDGYKDMSSSAEGASVCEDFFLVWLVLVDVKHWWSLGLWGWEESDNIAKPQPERADADDSVHSVDEN